jgi:mannose-6-phosphate isomerase-like protein (cupin superfamily)
MNIQRFVKDKAFKAHKGTILASDFLPAGLAAPFKSAYGYLENHASMEGHAHPAVEIYVVMKGRGRMTVGDESADVEPGDVVEIPSNVYHTLTCSDGGPLLWAALWWPQQKG